jgi:hypothetical protein
LSGTTFSTSTTSTGIPAALICSTHSPQQPQLGSRVTVIFGSPSAARAGRHSVNAAIACAAPIMRPRRDRESSVAMMLSLSMLPSADTLGRWTCFQ